MPKRYVFRWEQKWVLDIENGKEERRLVIEEWGNVLEKALIDFGTLFQRIGAVWLNVRLDILAIWTL